MKWVSFELGNVFSPRHYLNRCWLIINWTFKNKPHWYCIQNPDNFVNENAFENVIANTQRPYHPDLCVLTLWVLMIRICHTLDSMALKFNETLPLTSISWQKMYCDDGADTANSFYIILTVCYQFFLYRFVLKQSWLCIFIKVTSHERQGVSNHGKLDCLFITLFRVAS